MTVSLESIQTEALKLTPEERVVLADHLLASLSFGEVENAWAEEMLRRDAEVDAGTSLLVPADEAIASARRAIG